MDTISRENNSMLPVGAIIVGVIALLLGGYAAITLSKVNKTLADQEAKIAKVESIETTATAAATAADKASKDVQALRTQTQAGFDQVGPIIGELRASVTKLEESAKKPAPVAGKDKKGGAAAAASGEPAGAGGEYTVKAGDSGTKIATANGVTIGELQAANPGVNWTKLKVGDKLKLPKK